MTSLAAAAMGEGPLAAPASVPSRQTPIGRPRSAGPVPGAGHAHHLPPRAARCDGVVGTATWRRRQRRRRVLIGVAATAVLVVLALPWGGAGRPRPAASPGTVEAVVAHRPYVVQPGDTLWAIATRLVGPAGDPRPVVSEIEAENRGVAIIPGAVLRLP